MNAPTNPNSPTRSHPARDPGSRPAWTVRVAMWSARHRWPVMLAWFAFTFGLLAVSVSLGGIRSVSATGGTGAPQTESGRALAAMNPTGTAASPEEFDVVITSASLAATDPAFHSTVEAIVDRLRAVRATVAGVTGPALSEIADPYAAPAVAGYVAPDNTSVRIVGRIDGDASALETRTKALVKDAPRETLFASVRSAATGGSPIAPAVAARLVAHLQRDASAEPEPLSVREIEVVSLVARGASNREIARDLRISEATVKTHLIHIFEKLGVGDRTSAVTSALERGLIQLPRS